MRQSGTSSAQSEVASPESDAIFRRHYEILRMLLQRNGLALRLLADLEADLNYRTTTDKRLIPLVEHLQDEVVLMAQELNVLGNNRYYRLYTILEDIRGQIRKTFDLMDEETFSRLYVESDDEHAGDTRIVGGKAAGLAILRGLFPDAVPSYFIITPNAYRLFLATNHLSDKIRQLVQHLDVTADRDRIASITASIRDLIKSTPVPESVMNIMVTQVKKLEELHGNSMLEAGLAVRSSAIGEDGQLSFAGQFDTVLRVPTEDLAHAYRQVLASRFSERAVLYRLYNNFHEVDTPMAVLFMPMIEPRFSGMLLSADPRDGSRDRMIVTTTQGLAEGINRGTVISDTLTLSSADGIRRIDRGRTSGSGSLPDYLDEAVLMELAAKINTLRDHIGHDVEIEWVVNKRNRIFLLQCRRLRLAEGKNRDQDMIKRNLPLIDSGITIFAGQAEGKVRMVQSGEKPLIEPGDIMVVDQPTPDMSVFLPYLSAILAQNGNPVDHMATLAREYSIPCMYHLGDTVMRLKEGMTISVDATRRKIYEGSVWPDIRQRGKNRLRQRSASPRSGPLFELVPALNLTENFSSRFRPGGIRSIHDGIRYIHEMAVRSMFHFADSHNSFWRKRTVRLNSRLPMKIMMLDLDNQLSAKNRKEVLPEELNSVPFQAFWRGLSDPSLAWPDRWSKAMAGLSRDYQDQILGGTSGPRRRKDPNYCIIARDYLNFNARFTYHYTMVDSLIGLHDHLNYIHFRFYNGGASLEQRKRRVRFLELILREFRFNVDSREDLLVAWFRQYPQQDSEQALTTLGRILVCARQLDLVLLNDHDIERFVSYFMEGKYGYFH